MRRLFEGGAYSGAALIRVNTNEFTIEDKEIEGVVSPVILSKKSVCVEETQRLLKLHKNSEPDEESSESLLRQPANDGVEIFVDRSLTVTKENHEKKKTDFVALNDGSEPSACNSLKDQQLLESPSHLPVVSVNDNNSKKFISSLESFERSPEINSPPLTPNKIKQCVQNIWENEKLLFSEHLAMVFPVPSTSSGRKKGRSTTLIQMAIKKLTLSEECLEGKLELGVPWDPLAISTTKMENCQKNLQSLSLWSREKEERGGRLAKQNALPYSKETFHKTSIHADDGSVGGLSRAVSPAESQTERQSGTDIERAQASATQVTENRITLPENLNTIKIPANLISRSSVTSQRQTQGATNEEKEQQKPPLSKSTALPSLKQTSDGIEDFFLLREGQVATLKSSTQAQCTPPKNVVKAAKVRPSVFTTESGGGTETNSVKQTTDSKCEERALTVELSGEFQEVLDELIGHVKPLLSRLQGNGVIPQNKTLSNLNPEYTRFVLKQAQMCVKEGEENSKESQIYCMTVCLHALVSSVDILMQSGLEATLAYLSSTQEKYGRLLGGALESTRRYLLETHFTFQQQKILHPKLSKLLNIVARWSKEQETDSAKAAIITYTFPEKTNKEIIETLSGLHGVQATLYKSATDVDTLEEEGKLYVYVVNGLSITEDFPWGIFDFVLDYDLNGTMEREVLSRSSQLRAHISLKTIARALLDKPLETKGASDTTQLRGQQDQYIFIGSEKITQNKDLLHLLETSHNVLIYERRNANARPKDSISKMCAQPDVMIDERTCIQLQHLPSLEDEREYECLRDTVLSLSLKCQKCCIIMYSNKQPDYAFTRDVLRHLSILFASFEYFQKSEFEVEIVYSFTIEDTAKLIRQIGDKARAQSTVWNKTEWPKRKWLTNEASAHEKFLLLLPCMNSFSAQVMLTAAPLTELLKMSRDELKETCPWIPQRTLAEFYKAINWCSELDSDLSVHSYVQPLNQQYNQTFGYSTFTGEPSPCQMSLATSDFNSSPESVISNRSGPMEYADYRGGLPPVFISTQPRKETNRDTATDKINCNLYKQDRPDTGRLSPVFISTQPRQETNRGTLIDKMNCNLYKPDKPDTGNLSASVIEDRYNPVPTANQSDYYIRPHSGQFQGVPALGTVEEEWRSSLLKNSSSKRWKAQLDVDLRRCITEEREPFSRYNPQLNEKYPIRSQYFPETYSSLRSRPGDFSKSQFREGNTEYLAGSKETSVNDPMTSNMVMSSEFPRVKEYAALPPRSEREEEYFPEVFRDMSRVSHQRYQQPDDYRIQDVPQASLKRSADSDVPSKRARQAVRVLDLGNEASRTLPTKVGIAQPQRRPYGSTSGHHQVPMSSKSSQVLGENSVASKHKRFSLGIARSTDPTTRSAQQLFRGEREVPGVHRQPSPDEPDEWSIFPSYLSSKRRKLTYEKMPGVESGQTKLVFK
ncbi:hypothetical protein ACROYT_G043564 [Oculina patagonica]